MTTRDGSPGVVWHAVEIARGPLGGPAEAVAILAALVSNAPIGFFSKWRARASLAWGRYTSLGLPLPTAATSDGFRPTETHRKD